MKRSVLFARFPFGAQEHPDTTDWLVQTVIKAKSDRRIGEVLHTRVDDTPITMSRNKVMEQAKRLGVDLLLMIDSDMNPDLKVPGAKPFWDSSLDFMLAHNGPCVVAAPYCGKPPVENVFIFRWQNMQSDHPNLDMRLGQVNRDAAAMMTGFEEVAALPTGLILIDMRAIAKISPPYFYYEWKDKTESEKASTEDVTFTRDLSLAGVPIYVNWDAWAGHWKAKCVGKPTNLSIDHIRSQFVETIKRNQRSDERIVMVGEGQDKPPVFTEAARTKYLNTMPVYVDAQAPQPYATSQPSSDPTADYGRLEPPGHVTHEF